MQRNGISNSHVIEQEEIVVIHGVAIYSQRKSHRCFQYLLFVSVIKTDLLMLCKASYLFRDPYKTHKFHVFTM